MGRRVLITGLGTYWGGRLAQELERDPDVEVIIGLDVREPQVRLERTEYVRSDENYSILSRIVKATRVDTIVHTFLIVDSTKVSSRQLHEINVIGTMNLFAAASAEGSTVRRIVVKSSALVYGSSPRDPRWFTETSTRSFPARTRIERSLIEVGGYVRDFAIDNPHVEVTLLRYSNVLGPNLPTPFSKALQLPVVPSVLGFDPSLQLVHVDDVVRSLLFCIEGGHPGIYNVAGDGLLPWSEIAALCGKVTVPLPFVGTNLAAEPLRRLGVDIPPELLELLRYGRGIDTRRLKEEGFTYKYTTAGAVKAFIEGVRLRRLRGDQGYEYQEDVEQFFRHSPAVIRDE